MLLAFSLDIPMQLLLSILLRGRSDIFPTIHLQGYVNVRKCSKSLNLANSLSVGVIREVKRNPILYYPYYFTQSIHTVYPKPI